MKMNDREEPSSEKHRESCDVWIVQHQESVNAVLGVFATEKEADGFAEEVAPRFCGGVIYVQYAIGHRYDRGSRIAEFDPGD